MYELILEALYRLNNLTGAEEKAHYLQSLKSVAQQLRGSYNPNAAPTVRVNYRPKNVQAAYMLRYFPQYSQVLRIILNRLKNAQVSLPFDQENLSACFFGAGPAPEVYGFAQFLNAAFSNNKKLTAYTFDIISDEWNYSRGITEHSLVPSIWQNRTFELISKKFDITQANSVNQFAAIVGQARLIVFQNCLNEINQNSYPSVIANLKSLIGSMSSGSVLTVIDLSSYPAALQLISQIESLIRSENLASILISPSEGEKTYDAVALRDSLPNVIVDNLLTSADGLIPRRWVKYRCLVIRKLVAKP